MQDIGSFAVIRYDRTAIGFELDCASTVDLAATVLVADQTPSQTHWHVQLDEQACWWERPGETGFEVTYEEVSVAGRIPHPAL